jgi:hypothetical protein
VGGERPGDDQLDGTLAEHLIREAEITAGCVRGFRHHCERTDKGRFENPFGALTGQPVEGESKSPEPLALTNFLLSAAGDRTHYRNRLELQRYGSRLGRQSLAPASACFRSSTIDAMLTTASTLM